MAAVNTLTNGNLPTAIGPFDARVPTENITGLATGVFLWVDQELLKVIAVQQNGVVHVQRGQAGTSASAHASGAITWLVPTGDMVYDQDPKGPPPLEPYVVPYINAQLGRMFWPVGDETGPGAGNRTWQIVTATPGFGSLGIRAVLNFPTASS